VTKPIAYASLFSAAALMASAAVNGPVRAADQAPMGQTMQTVEEQSGPSSPGAQVVTNQSIDEWRAPKLIGVAVYGPDNKKIGTITDILIGHDGAARSVVIGVGGFLGMGTKDVAVPFGALQWRTESRNVPTEPASTVANTATGEAAKPQTRKIDPAAEEASQGYPDKAMLNMTVAQLKAAPDFKYAPDPAAQTESASQGLEQRSHAQTSVPKP
jgi:PRC-barrel domain